MICNFGFISFSLFVPHPRECGLIFKIFITFMEVQLIRAIIPSDGVIYDGRITQTTKKNKSCKK